MEATVTTRDWKARFYQKNKVIAMFTFKDRTEHEAEKEAMSVAPEKYDDWSMVSLPNLEEITAMQKQYGLTELQERINSGLAWLMEGQFGRTAMSALESGACMLPLVPRRDAYGTIVPPRTRLKEGTKGTLELSQDFWKDILDGTKELPEPKDECTEE